jgi:hypothetical protein
MNCPYGMFAQITKAETQLPPTMLVRSAPPKAGRFPLDRIVGRYETIALSSEIQQYLRGLIFLRALKARLRVYVIR